MILYYLFTFLFLKTYDLGFLSSGNSPNKRHSLSSEIPLKELIVNNSTERFSKDFTIVSR